MNPRCFGLFLALWLPASAGLAANTVYRWTDAQGNVHYSDQVTAGARGVQSFHVAPPGPESMAELQVERDGEGSVVYVVNQLAGPLEIDLSFDDASNARATPALPIHELVAGNQRRQIARIDPADPDRDSHYTLNLTNIPGSPSALARDVAYNLPVDESSPWQLGQIFHGGFSHSDEQNRYAVDLIAPIGTPVLAARGGVVMQVQSGFDRAGLDKDKYGERANYIRILHDDGSMGLYAHLKQDGVMVRVGQTVSLGQLIGYTGNTGFSSGPHLHFCVQVNRGMHLVSIPFRMVGPNGFLPLSAR